MAKAITPRTEADTLRIVKRFKSSGSKKKPKGTPNENIKNISAGNNTIPDFLINPL